MSKYFIFLFAVVLCCPAYAQTEAGIPPAVTAAPSNAIDPGQIHDLLNHLGYPPKAWPAIEGQVTALLTKINFYRLKAEAGQAKSDPLKLKKFVEKVGGLLEQEGYIELHPPHPLIKLLTGSLVDDDISQVILTSPTSFYQKVQSKKSLVACTAISQLGSIVLKLLGIDVKVGFSPAHVFNCIPLDGRHVLFVDFSNQIFPIVDIDQYYQNLGSETRLLKDQYHISPQRLIEINAQMPGEFQADSLQEQLGFLYLYTYISDDYATTPAIFINLGDIYSNKGNYAQALLEYNQAINIDPDYAEAFRERGITYADQGSLDQAISDLNKAIELFPDFAEAYDERGNIYGGRGDMDKAINDFNQAVIINPDYTEAYHDRGLMYSKEGDMDQAILDYNKAIDIDSYFADAYKSRAEAYFSKKEYDQAWADVHKVGDLGDEVSSDFLEKLKQAQRASQFRNFFLIGAVAAVLIFLIFGLF